MDYTKLYASIIEKAKLEKRKKGVIYYEKHHIVPKCVGGTNDKENLVFLTAKEHFICHRLLCYIYKEPKLKYAYWAMCNQISGDVQRNYKISGRAYEEARKMFKEEHSLFAKKRVGEKNSFFGKKHSEKTKARWSEIRSGKNTGSDNTFYGKKHSEETKSKIRKARKKYTDSERGKKQLAEYNQLRKIVFCPELNMEFSSIKEAAKYFCIKYSSMKYIITKYGKYKEYTLIARLAKQS